MLHAVGEINDQPAMGIGLSRDDLQKIIAGKPVIIDLRAQGQAGYIFVFPGDGDDDMEKALEAVKDGLRDHALHEAIKDMVTSADENDGQEGDGQSAGDGGEGGPG